MDVASGVLLLLLGSIITFLVFLIIVYAEMPKEVKNQDNENPILNFWRTINK